MGGIEGRVVAGKNYTVEVLPLEGDWIFGPDLPDLEERKGKGLRPSPNSVLFFD